VKRAAKPDTVARLAYVKSLIAQMRGAMPTHAAELRREATEELDELMKALA
jgi:hypothetical protein